MAGKSDGFRKHADVDYVTNLEQTQIKPESATIFPAHPLFSVLLNIHGLEKRVVAAEARNREYKWALDDTAAKLRRARARIRKLSAKVRDAKSKRR